MHETLHPGCQKTQHNLENIPYFYAILYKRFDSYHVIRVLLHKVESDELISQRGQTTDEKLSLKGRNCLKETETKGSKSFEKVIILCVENENKKNHQEDVFINMSS